MPIIYFISDVHLGIGDREAERRRKERLVAFLEEVENFASHLYIVGDLFDFWYEYRSVIPRGYHDILAQLGRIRRGGIGVDYLRGNHDFGAGDFFAKELGIPVWEHDLRVEWAGKRFYLYHGDGLAEKDGGYRILKKIMRNRASRWAFRWIHPDLGIRLAHASSDKSRNYTAAKDYGEKDGMAREAERRIAEGFDYVIMGHRHKPVLRPIGAGVYVNLGDWITHFSYALFDGAELKLLTYPE